MTVVSDGNAGVEQLTCILEVAQPEHDSGADSKAVLLSANAWTEDFPPTQKQTSSLHIS